MKHIKNILKISILLLLLLVCVGSIYAADNNQTVLSSLNDDDFDLDEYLDDDSDWDDTLDEDLEDDDVDDDSDWDDSLDEDLDDGDDLDEDDDLDLDDGDLDEDDEDYNESDYNFTDFDYLKLKITYYLDKYGNYSTHNWTESEEFINEYQIYILNTTAYKLNESAEGYETYLKIFESVTSTFGEYNLTENETEYLKFMVIFYLNHYGNVSANYTWNESDDFNNFTFWFDMCSLVLGSSSMIKPISADLTNYAFENLNNPFITIYTNSTDMNITSNNDSDNIIPSQESTSWDNVIILILVLIFMVFVII